MWGPIMKAFIILACLFVEVSNASDNTDRIWSKALKDNEVTELNQQSYCYTNSEGTTSGKNIDSRIRLASVSKTLTSLWTIEKLGPHYIYNTKLTIKDHSLHISGSFDPFFGEEKLFFLLSQLNELGYTEFDKITFDKNLIVFPDAQDEVDVYPKINANSIIHDLKNYFNTDSWNKNMQDEYDYIASIAKKGKFLDHVQFRVGDISMVETNPFLNDADAKTLNYNSPELYKYLKEMNVKSNNFVAHTLFLQLGGEQKYADFLKNSFDLDESKIHFYSGSGLPTYINGERKDNYATCAVVNKLLAELKKSIEKQNMTIEDILAVPGSDKGTFRNRTFAADLKNSFVAKTGTLTNVSTLAGVMSTKNGYGYFGVFNQTPNISGAKKVQEIIVESIMQDLGGPKAFEYTSQVFHTYDRNQNIKNNLRDEDLNNNFTTAEALIK